MKMNKLFWIILFFLLAACETTPTPSHPKTSPPTSTPPPTNTSITGKEAIPATSEAASSHTNTWIRTFEGSDYGAFFDIVLTPDGNALAVGTTNHLHFPPYSGDALFMKLSLDGDVLWEKTWGGEDYEQAWAVSLAEGGGFYIFGETDSYGAGDRDFFLLKITEDGTEEWYKTYGYAYREWPYGMLQLSNGDLLIYGFTESVITRERNQYVLRLGKDGSILWENTVESP